MKLIPGMGQLADVDVDERQLKRVEAIVLSMTPHERAVPHAIDGRRRERIARGSGTTVPEVNKLLEARKMMERVMKQVGSGKMPSLPGMGGLPGHGRHAGDAGRPGPDPPSRLEEEEDEAEGKEALVGSGTLSRLWQSSSGSRGWARRRTRSTASSRPTRDRRATGRFLEIVGRYNPQTEPSTIELDEAKVKDWLGKGAQPTEAVSRLLKVKGIDK
jgi:ribosomal protein S16